MTNTSGRGTKNSHLVTHALALCNVQGVTGRYAIPLPRSQDSLVMLGVSCFWRYGVKSPLPIYGGAAKLRQGLWYRSSFYHLSGRTGNPCLACPVPDNSHGVSRTHTSALRHRSNSQRIFPQGCACLSIAWLRYLHLASRTDPDIPPYRFPQAGVCVPRVSPD